MRLMADGGGSDTASGREAVEVVSEQGRRSNSQRALDAVAAWAARAAGVADEAIGRVLAAA